MNYLLWLSSHSNQSWLLYSHYILSSILFLYLQFLEDLCLYGIYRCTWLQIFLYPYHLIIPSTSSDAVSSRCRMQWPGSHTILSAIVCYWWQFFKEIFIFQFLFVGYIQALSMLHDTSFLYNIPSTFLPRTFYVTIFHTYIAAYFHR